ncbi:hypothetical protein GCM10020367_15740 [Streptomyces sannanensis]|uniref:HNH endonuclease n=1 Tax=Streptomyces sannanensis TaxID=285536 RepID=A0ABP6S7X7_9ACTN
MVPTGKKTGTHTGRIAVRATGKFNIRTAHGLIQGIHHRHLRLLQRADGYAYTTRPEGQHSEATLRRSAPHSGGCLSSPG